MTDYAAHNALPVETLTAKAARIQDEQGAAPTFGRPFALVRDTDTTGVSGTGHICDGILFPDGHAALHWRGRWPLTTPHPEGLASILDIHNHGGEGSTRVVWPDEVDDPSAPAADVVHPVEEQQASDVPEVDDDPLLPGDVLRTRDETLLQFPSSPEVARAELSRIQRVARRYRDELSTVDAALRTAGIAQAGALGVSDLAARCRELTEQLTAVRAELIGLRPASGRTTPDNVPTSADTADNATPSKES